MCSTGGGGAMEEEAQINGYFCGLSVLKREGTENDVMVVLEGSVGNIRMRERERELGEKIERKGKEGTALHLMSRKFRVNDGFVFFFCLIK